MDLSLTLAEAAERIRLGVLTSTDLTKSVFARADQLDAKLGTYVARFDRYALTSAARADRYTRSGRKSGRLHGLPVGIKDVIATREGPTTAGSLVADPKWGSGRDAPVVARLRKAGAVITGKLTTSEFAIGRPDPAKPFPIPRNPWDLKRWSGGSSAGSGNGVAAGLVMAALGTDTGGSVRGPAAACGITGLVPTYGRVPRTGVIPLAFTLDRIGAMARSVEDCALVLSSIMGKSRTDPSSLGLRPPGLLPIKAEIGGLRVGVDPVHRAHEDADPAVDECFSQAIQQLADMGATVKPVSLPYYPELCIATHAIMTSEALAYHARDLGVRWHDYYSTTRSRLAKGVFISGADYVQAMRLRTIVLRRLARLFDEVDVVATPTTGFAALEYDDQGYVHDPSDKMSRLYFTVYWSAVGNPVLAIPMGFNGEGLPLSLQIAGRALDEATVVRVGHAFQQATGWHKRLPPLVQEARFQTEGRP